MPKLSFEFLRQGVTPPKKQNRAVLGTPLYERYSQPGIGFWTIGSLYPRDNIPREFFGEFLQRVSIALAMQSAVLAMIDSV